MTTKTVYNVCCTHCVYTHVFTIAVNFSTYEWLKNDCGSLYSQHTGLSCNLNNCVWKTNLQIAKCDTVSGSWRKDERYIIYICEFIFN